ncbi:methyl-accepting chemotaxis protein [Motilimonas cestriensis]|uniref:Methyl-accepting chemotaxis protein n=1 Tax=Motilimonas cestriensis TaxID=2742685 RepID=A0ABS8WCM3_9GAMM|nr:methyl-accepting chemotaxis protein [Motilimonas cestriensis]MCE2596018.1 methyl-accepting chemotaxis protein [Motilimonas cestriensis]
MLIKHKFIANSIVITIGLLLLFSLLIIKTSELEKLSDTALVAESIKTDMLMLRRHEKDFLSRNDLKYQQKFNDDFTKTSKNLAAMRTFYQENNLPSAEINTTIDAMEQYQVLFNQLVTLQVSAGLDHESGLNGALRDSAHAAEQFYKNVSDFESLANYLMLRRFEKDFMLRLDLKYLDRFNKLIATMIEANQGEAKQSLIDYHARFNDYVKQEQAIGLNANEGLLGELRATIHQTEDALDTVEKQINSIITKSIAATKNQAILIFAVIILAIIAFSIILSRSILAPLTRLSDTMSDINHNKDLSKRAHIIGSDEIANVGKNFDEMLATFQDLIQDVNHAVDTLSSAAEELSLNASETRQGIANQLHETDMVATAVTEMGSTIDDIARNTEAAAHRAGDTNNNAIKGRQSVGQTIEKINNLANSLTLSSKAVEELEQESQTIGQVLEVIRGIAEQTNLLALNAAIEAARAGEQGRGFAVVADEVRSLAQRTQNSTQEISNIISSLQGKTSSIVDLIKNCHGQGQESTEQAELAGELLEQITRDVTNISDTSTQIAAAIEEQSTVAAEVNRNIVNIRDIAETSNQAASHTSQASEEILNQANVLTQSVRRFKL